ncbi:phosphoadenylyl-sulfate reductase [Rhodobacteraceae bacterium NNCM2]|nr:phosphoadenylyl-sulfate reductase [Coraliihabitans acroporae]
MADGSFAPLAELLDAQYEGAAAEKILGEVIGAHFRGRIALVSSFGADSAVLLHMVAEIDRALPVIMLETGMLFPETLTYQRELTERLGLTDVRLIRPDETDLALLDPAGQLFKANTDGCCHLRKTLPLRRALEGFDASITGRKRDQAASRASMPVVETDAQSGKLKINPLANWTASELKAYRDAHDLPPHPLVAEGFPSIGCAPCTSRVAEGEDARSGRWRGSDKIECGIHFDGTNYVRGPGAGI